MGGDKASSVRPSADSAANINDGSKTFSVATGKKVWSDWERDDSNNNVYHTAPWVGIVLGNGNTPVKTLVNKISIGFIDEAASDDPNVTQGHMVRVPARYEVQYYTGSVESLDYNASSVNNGRNWPNMNGNDNWATVTEISQDEIPSSANYAQMLDVTFKPVETAAIRVVMTPQAEQWVGVDELEVYDVEASKNSNFEVSTITVGGKDVLAQFEEKHLTVTVEKGAVVHDSIVMPGSVIKAGAVVEYSIVAEDVVVGENALVGCRPENMEDKRNWGVTVIAKGIQIGKGAKVPAKAMIEQDVPEVSGDDE